MSRPMKLSTQVIDTHQWDRSELRRVAKDVKEFTSARKKLGRFVPTGKEALNDAFWVLHKATPRLRDADTVAASHLVNRAIIVAMLELPDVERLRAYTVGDELHAALSCVSLEPDLETLFDRFAQEAKLAERLQAELDKLTAAQREAAAADKDLDEMVQRWSQGGGQEADLDAATHRLMKAELDVTELGKGAAELREELTDALDARRGTLTLLVRDALGQVCGNAAQMESTSRAWGLGPGELQRVPADQRLALARKLNTPRMRDIARLFGRIHTMALSDQQVGTRDGPLSGVEFGRDLGRMAPSEFINLSDSRLEVEFFRRFTNHRLMQYARDEEHLERGGIVLCVDGSYSMVGERELWSKAVMLVLMHLALAQERTMHVIHFGSPGQIAHFPFEKRDDFTSARIIEAAEHFFASGTDFVTPLSYARNVMLAEHAATGAVRSDLVFLSDGFCDVPEDFMKEHLEVMHRLSTTTWSICADYTAPTEEDPLYQMAEGKVALVGDFSSGTDVRDVFRLGAARMVFGR